MRAEPAPGRPKRAAPTRGDGAQRQGGHDARRLLALLLAGLAGAAHADESDAAMHRLAETSGCSACHAVDGAARSPGKPPPIGPAWREVAWRYRGQPGAAQRLGQTVLDGSNPYDSHWKGKVSGVAMPRNQTTISPADAQRLLRWILALPPATP